MGDLAVLRTAKQAMDESLITQEDFDVVKRAFLKAQQIKAGLDAGFIREEDYVQARDSFLHSLDFRVSSFSAPALVPAPTNAAVASGSSGRGAASIPKIGSQLGLTNGGHTQAPVHRSAAQLSNLSTITAPQPAAAAAPPAGPPLTARGSNDYSGSNGGAEHSGMPGTVPLPADLPRIGRAGTTAGKKSMSGIGVSEQCVNVFNHMKTKSAFKWVTYKIDDAGLEVVVDQLGAPSSSYDQFLAVLPEGRCRYAVFDYAYTNADTGQVINKLVFIHWAPSGSTIKSKMMYASTKDFLKGFLDGVGAELQGDTLDELAEGELVERVGAAMTRK